MLIVSVSPAVLKIPTKHIEYYSVRLTGDSMMILVRS